MQCIYEKNATIRSQSLLRTLRLLRHSTPQRRALIVRILVSLYSLQRSIYCMHAIIQSVAAFMSEIDKTVFISYRRKFSAGWARAILQDLKTHGYDVFVDVDSIDSGKFETVILNQIEARAHFLLILTPGSLDRCSEPDDWLTREIRHAIELQRNIVPLTLEQFSFAKHAQPLPAALAPLIKFNALAIYHDYFDQGMTKLRDRFLKQPMVGAIKPTPKADRPKFLELLNATNREFGAFDPKLKPIDWLSPMPSFLKDRPDPDFQPDAKKEEKSKSFDLLKLLQMTDPGKAPFGSVQPVKPAFRWTGSIANNTATGDYLKPGNFQLNAAGIPLPILQKLEEMLAGRETIKQVAFGPNGSWVILRNLYGFWEQGVPEEMSKQLWDQFNQRREIFHVALGAKNSWVIMQGARHLMAKTRDIPASLLDKLLELYQAKKEFKWVSISATGGWVVLFGSNGFWADNIPVELFEKMHEWGDLHYDLKQVTFGPNSSCILLAGDNAFWYRLIPQKMADKLNEYQAAGKTIKSVALAPDSGWVILGDA